MTDPITTPEALDALPIGSVVMDRFGDAWLHDTPNIWAAAETARMLAERIARKYGPFTVLFRPDAPTPTPADGGDPAACGCGNPDAHRIAPAPPGSKRAQREAPTPAGDDQPEALAQVIYEAHPWVDYNDVNGPVVPPRVVPWSEVKTLARIRFLEAADAVLTALSARPSAPTWTVNEQRALRAVIVAASDNGDGTYAVPRGDADYYAAQVLAAGWSRRPSVPTVTTEQVGAAVIASGLDHHIGASDTIAFLAALGIEVTP